MNEKNSTISFNYEAECKRLTEKIECIKAMHCDETEKLKRRIVELECDLREYEAKWSVIQLIFGK